MGTACSVPCSELAPAEAGIASRQVSGGTVEPSFIAPWVGNACGGLKRNKIPILLQVEQSKRKQAVHVNAASWPPLRRGWRVGRFAAESPDLVSSLCGSVKPVDDYYQVHDPLVRLSLGSHRRYPGGRSLESISQTCNGCLLNDDHSRSILGLVLHRRECLAGVLQRERGDAGAEIQIVR